MRAAVRDLSRAESLPRAVERFEIGEIGARTDWQAALRGAAAVAHLASGVGPQSDPNRSLLERYREVNVAGTRSLVMAAAENGVQRLLFVSSIKVNGEQTTENKPFTEIDRPRPEDAYAQSKWETEQMLWEQARANGIALTVLRPPVVYGPGVKGNFLALMTALQRGLPLPLGSVRNRRSLIYLGNLVDAVVSAMAAPGAAGKTYLVSDGEDVSTPELIRALAAALGVRSRLLPCPPRLLELGATLLGKTDHMRRLTGSLQIDSSKIRSELGWKPPCSLAHGLEATARWYRQVMGEG